MPAALELEGHVRCHLGPHVTLALRYLGETRPHVELREQRRRGLHPADRISHAAAQRVHQLRLVRRDLLLGAEHFGFVFLELRRDVALGAREGLAPFVVGRDPLPMRVRDFDVVAEHPVEPDLERRDPGALAFGRLQ